MSNIKCSVQRDVLVVGFTLEHLSQIEDVAATGAQLLAMTCQAPDGRMLLDFGGVEFMNSSMVGQLFVLSKRCRNDGITLRACNLNPTIRQVLEIVGLSNLIRIVEEEENPFDTFDDSESSITGLDTIEMANIDQLKSRAAGGEVAAMIQLGESLENGTAGEHDVDEAFRWFREAAERGDADGQFKTGMAYAYGIGVDPDWNSAMDWYRRAANQGHAEAEYAVGMIHCYGLAGESNKPKAIEWYKRSLADGYQRAGRELARLQ
jgi:anti-anti-sigma factor